MKITPEQVDYVAVLGRLYLTEQEKNKYLNQLDDILRYMETLDSVCTDDVEPMASPVELFNPFREDVVKPSLPMEQALANAPAVDGTSFKVPKILD
ncbi:MAG: Asp-tRNA(Asn)/Glu-tRNA(Gln) amidotransferase subunit GatC [Desulfomonilaceae bacterium]